MAQGLSLEDVGITSTENTPTPVVSSTTIPPIGKVEKQLFPMEELEKQIFGSSSRMGRQEQGLSLKDVGLTLIHLVLNLMLAQRE